MKVCGIKNARVYITTDPTDTQKDSKNIINNFRLVNLTA